MQATVCLPTPWTWSKVQLLSDILLISDQINCDPQIFVINVFLFFLDASLAAELDVFGINGQIEHKLAFLKKHVPRETSLVLIGHSIGCYIILEIMKRDPKLKVILIYHICPNMGIKVLE